MALPSNPLLAAFFFIFALAGHDGQVTAFVSRMTPWRTTRSHFKQYGLMASSTDASKDIDLVSEKLNMARHQKYPSNEEQLRLLGDAVELRRLKQVEHDELAKLGKQSLPRLMICEASGYGEDLDAYESALDAGHKARESLITRNMGLVYYVVKDVVGTPKHKKRSLQSLSIDDLVQEGAIGLSRAVDRWNPEIGGRFSTYAVYWIRAAVLRCIAERDDLVRVPAHVTTAVNKLAMASKTLGLSVDGDAFGDEKAWMEAKEARELAEAAGLSEAQLARAMQVQRRRRRGGMLSFETWMQQGKDLESDVQMTSSLTSLSSSSIDSELLRRELGKFLRPKEAEALSWRYGLTNDHDAEKNDQVSTSSFPKVATRGKWGEAMSFDEVGKRMQVSAEYGRRLCQKALSKLRLAHEEGRLEPSLLAL